MWSVPYITNMAATITAGGLETCEQFQNGAGGDHAQLRSVQRPRGKEAFAARRKAIPRPTRKASACLPAFRA